MKYSEGKRSFRWSVELKRLGNAEVTHLMNNMIYVFYLIQKTCKFKYLALGEIGCKLTLNLILQCTRKSAPAIELGIL
jgi:hypothetical protein